MKQKLLSALSYISAATLVGVALFVGGYLLVVNDRHDAYGLVIFFLLPFIVGCAIGAIGRHGLYVVAAVALTTILSLGLLILVGFEGWICCLMALPLIVLPMAVGAIVGYFVYGRRLDRQRDTARTAAVLLIMCPFLMAGAGQLEKPWRNRQRVETFTSEVLVPLPPSETWDRVMRMPDMRGDLPFLLRIGLPVPYRCTLDRDAVGGRRTCYFDQGIIEMDVTDWQPSGAVGMKITRSTLPGRRWLAFVDANYELVPERGSTRVVRHTTIASRLYPRWYWRPLEAWGVTSEHRFVLSSLANSASTN